jgi:hypothetical protein
LNSIEVTAQHNTAFQRKLASYLPECHAIFLVSRIFEQRKEKLFMIIKFSIFKNDNINSKSSSDTLRIFTLWVRNMVDRLLKSRSFLKTYNYLGLILHTE